MADEQDTSQGKAAALAAVEKASRIASMAVDVARTQHAGGLLSFAEYQATQKPGTQVDHAEFVEAQLTAEQALARSWGVIPTPMRLSVDTWEALPVKQQAAFLNAGGTLYDLERPPAKKENEPINWNGKQITRGEWDAMTNEQRAAFAS